MPKVVEPYRLILQTTMDGFLLVDIHGRLLEVNDAYCRMSGYTSSELLSMCIQDIEVLESPSDTAAHIQKIIEQGNDRFESRHRRKDGTILNVEVSVQYLPIDGGRFVSFLRDINERKMAEKTLKESHERLVTVLNGLESIVYVADMKTYEVLFTNNYFKKLFGDVVGKQCWKTIQAGQVGPCAFCTNDKLLDANGNSIGIYHWEFQNTANGRWYDIRDRALQWIDGRMVRLEIATDITESKLAENSLRQSEGRFRELAESLPMTIFEIDLQGRFTYVNSTGIESFGYSASDIESGMNVMQILSAEDRNRARAHIARRISGSGPFYHEYKGLRKDGTSFPISVISNTIILNDKVVGLRGIVTDLSERKRLEQELQNTQKLQSIGTLAGGIAHDFNNLLQGIFGYISMAKINIDQREKALAMLNQAEEALHVSVNLTNQLLTFAKGGKPVKKLIRIEPVIERAVKFALSGSHTNYKLDIPNDIWAVEADEGQVAQVIQNIVLNADQAMAGSGTVQVFLSNVDIAPDMYSSLHAGGAFIRSYIQDSGIGISEQNLANIFDPYFTTKQKGSGLGLATSYSIINNHGGLIQVKSELNGGTTFTIYLPAVKKAHLQSESKPLAEAAVKTGRILLMDDEDIVRSVAKEMIVALGHEVECAEDGKKAIDMFIRNRDAGTPFDLVILDLTVKGGMSGEEAISRIRAIDPDVRAIVSSGYSDSPVVANYKEFGFSGCLSKPYQIDALKSHLNSLIR